MLFFFFFFKATHQIRFVLVMLPFFAAIIIPLQVYFFAITYLKSRISGTSGGDMETTEICNSLACSCIRDEWCLWLRFLEILAFLPVTHRKSIHFSGLAMVQVFIIGGHTYFPRGGGGGYNKAE